MSFLSKLVDKSSELSLINKVVGDKGDPAKQLLGSQPKLGVVNDPTKTGSASDRMGSLVRAEWDDYVTRFQPYDQKLIGLATGDADNIEAVNRAQNSVGESFNVAQGTLARNRERLGLSTIDDEAAVQDRNTTTARTSSQLDAINGTRIHAQDRDLSLLAGDAAAGLKSGRLSGA